MGGCRDNDLDYKTFVLHGHFSIIEKSDPHGTCHRLFENKKHLKSHTEVLLNTGLNHGFYTKDTRRDRSYRHMVTQVKMETYIIKGS